MKVSIHRLALFGLVAVGLACFFSIAGALTTSAYASPTLEKPLAAPENRRTALLSCDVNNPEPAVGENVIFSGYLRDNNDNSPIAGENISLYKRLLENDVSLGTATTDENGYFTLSLEVPEQGIFCYIAWFPGNDDYENSISPDVYLSNIDKPLIFWSYAGILMAVVGVGIFLLRIGISKAHYLVPVLIGFTLGFLLIFIGAGMLSMLAGGAITGYLFAKNAPEWTKHLRVGCITGLIFLLALGLIFVYYIVAFPPELVVLYSITQAGIFASLFNSTIFSLVYYLLFVGMGAVVGGMLRKLLKPGEQKPSAGGGETTSEGVEQKPSAGSGETTSGGVEQKPQ